MRTSTFGQQRSRCFNLLYNESYQWFEGKLIMIPDIHPVAVLILMKFCFSINFHVVQKSIKLEIMNEANNVDLFSISARTLWPFLYFPDGGKATPTRWNFSQINASTREPSVHAVKNWICSAKQQPEAYRKILIGYFHFPHSCLHWSDTFMCIYDFHGVMKAHRSENMFLERDVHLDK